MEKITEFTLSQSQQLNLLSKLSGWAKSFKYVAIYHSNHYPDQYGKYETLAAFGAYRIFQASKQSLESLKAYQQEQPSWLFGHFGFELKDQLEELETRHAKTFEFGDCAFFEPAYLVLQERGSDQLQLYANFDVDTKPLSDLKHEIQAEQAGKAKRQQIPRLTPRMSKKAYLDAVQRLKEEIQYGNVYELNYCQEFFAEKVEIEPHLLMAQLNEHSPMPFAAFYKLNDQYLMGASPERYLCKRGEKLISQPIKGTAKRGKNEAEDHAIKMALKADLKEQTENVMIVDLVRNDLSRTAAKSSVKVEELFGVYTFPQVHQLISTVISELKEGLHPVDVISNSFPMGSMTGAPKVSALQLIDKHEVSARELYSGSVGYFDPYGDFDFNVVIRSLLYHQSKQYLSLTVGGAITDLCVPENEYEECLLKAKAIFEQQKNH